MPRSVVLSTLTNVKHHISADKQIPKHGYGEDQNLRYLVMTRLGPDIQAAKEHSSPWSVSRIAEYASQMLLILRALHERCRMVFVDVKPGESQVWQRLGGKVLSNA